MKDMLIEDVWALVNAITDLYRDAIGSDPLDDTHAADWAMAQGLIQDDEREVLHVVDI